MLLLARSLCWFFIQLDSGALSRTETIPTHYYAKFFLLHHWTLITCFFTKLTGY